MAVSVKSNRSIYTSVDVHIGYITWKSWWLFLDLLNCFHTCWEITVRDYFSRYVLFNWAIEQELCITIDYIERCTVTFWAVLFHLFQYCMDCIKVTSISSTASNYSSSSATPVRPEHPPLRLNLHNIYRGVVLYLQLIDNKVLKSVRLYVRQIFVDCMNEKLKGQIPDDLSDQTLRFSWHRSSYRRNRERHHA
jgi:hypothetical protein